MYKQQINGFNIYCTNAPSGPDCSVKERRSRKGVPVVGMLDSGQRSRAENLEGGKKTCDSERKQSESDGAWVGYKCATGNFELRERM